MKTSSWPGPPHRLRGRKGADALKLFWKRLRPSKAAIEAVAMDMSVAYRGAVSTHLPRATIVFDRFHVIKLYSDRLSQLHREATEVMHKDVLKGTRWRLLKNPENLGAEKDEKGRLEEALALNKSLAVAYYMKEDLRRFWEQPVSGSRRPSSTIGSGERRRRGSRCSSRWPRRWRPTVAGCWRTTTR